MFIFKSNFVLCFGKHIDFLILKMIWHNITIAFQVEVVEGVAGEEDHHDEQEEHGEENAEAEGQHDEHDEDGMYNVHLHTYSLSEKTMHQKEEHLWSHQ